MTDEDRDPGEETDVEDDPRGGRQTDEYRHSGPTELVVEGDTAMMGPGGSPPRDDDEE
jgi:hypothetical protein